MTTPNTSFTYEPKLERTYRLEHLDIPPKDYDKFLLNCVNIYTTQTYPDIAKDVNLKDDINFQPRTLLLGQIKYFRPEVQIHQPAKKRDQKPDRIIKQEDTAYCEELARDLNPGAYYYDWYIHEPDFATKVQTKVQQINTQLDQRFPHRENKVPFEYIPKLKLIPFEIKLWMPMKYDNLTLTLDITLTADTTTMIDLPRLRSLMVAEPRLSISIKDRGADFSRLEALADSIEEQIQSRYPITERKTLIGYTERQYPELAEQKAQKTKAA